MPYYYGYGPGMMYGDWSVWGLIGHIVLVVFAIWVILMIVRAVFGFPRHGRHFGRHMRWGAWSALEILNERYAKGEIGKEEYEERRKTLLGQ